MGDVADGSGNPLPLEFMGIGLGDARVGVDHAVVGFSIAGGHAHHLEGMAAGDGDYPGHEAVGVGDLHFAGGHGFAHLIPIVEFPPPDLDAYGVVVRLLDAGHVVGGRPLGQTADRKASRSVWLTSHRYCQQNTGRLTA